MLTWQKTNLWCVNKTNLVSSRDEAPGYKHADCNSCPAWTERQKRTGKRSVLMFYIYVSMWHNNTNTQLPPNASIHGQQAQREREETQSQGLLPANTVNYQKDA